MSVVSPQNLVKPPPEYKNSTVLFSFHVKKVALKPWVTKYLDSVPLKLKWELEYLENDVNPQEQVPGPLKRWESGTFKLDGNEASNIDTVFMLAQTIKEKDTLVLNSTSLKVSLVIDNSTNVVVGTCVWNLDNFKVRSRFNPHSFELTNENKLFIGYVDIFYVSQQRWVRINKASLPMINKNETEYNSSPESNINTNTASERRSDDDTTLSCSSFGDTETPFSRVNSPREDYVLIFWNSTNTCFVKSHPNDIQLQLLYMFIKTCLIDGDSPNSVIPFQLEDIRPNEPFEVLKKFSSTIKPLSYKDAKTFMHLPHSHRGSSNKSSVDNDALEDDAKTTTTDETSFDIQHSARLYSNTAPTTERLMNDENINDPTSFYNFISKQNKHFQSLLTKRFLTPTSSINPSTNTSAISDANKFPPQVVKKGKYLDTGKTLKNDSARYSSLPPYAKSIDTVASFNDITQKTTNTTTTGLVSYRNQRSTTVDEESLTIGDATVTTIKTMNTFRTFQDKYGQGTSKTSLYGIEESAANLHTRDTNLGKVTEVEVAHEEVVEAQDDELKTKEPVETQKVEEFGEDKPVVVPESEVKEESKKSEGDYVTPSKGSITVYSIFSPKDYIDENFSDLSESVVETESDSPSNLTATESPVHANLQEIDKDKYFLGDEDKDGKIDKYFRNVKNAYYIPDSDLDPLNMLTNYQDVSNLKANRELHCERALLNFETISKDLQTIGELKSATDPELGSFDSSLIFKALQDAQVLKVQGQTLPTSAYLRFFLKYLKCYNLKRVPIVVYLHIITFKQLDTMKRLSSSPAELLNFINVALEALIYELQVSTSVGVGVPDKPHGLLFKAQPTFRNRTESDFDTEHLFLFESESQDVDFNEFETNSALSGDKYLIFQNILSEISREAQAMDTRRLVYVSRLNSPPVRPRACIFRISALKIALYRTFCGRRKLLSRGQLIKL